MDVAAMPPVAQPAPLRRLWPWAIVLLLAVGVALWGYESNWWRPAPQGWQAVFLTNGQVYFGHIVAESPKLVTLHDIYYLQGAAPLQAGGPQKPADLSLVKLGNELHGPTDEMRINRQQVLFTETLKDDSKVIQAISQYKGK